MGDRQSVSGDIILTFLIASRMAPACSSESFSGFWSGGTPARSQISRATLYDILENSVLRKLVILSDSVYFAMLSISPSSTPSGCGFTSFVGGGTNSEALSNTIVFPSGGTKVIFAWGLTIATPFRYSNMDCLPPIYLPLTLI